MGAVGCPEPRAYSCHRLSELEDRRSRVRIRIDLTDVVDGELLDGTMRVRGQLPGDYEPFETRMRLEFHDEADARTRLEVRQWLPEHLVSPTENGWSEAFSKLDAVLAA